eukprot:676603-Lingulodinium_polyedra.AAC.1
MLGVDGCKHVFVIRDMWSGMCQASPTKTRYTEEIVEAFKTFVGANPNHVFKLYSDMGREIVATLKEYHVLRQRGVLGIRQSNAVIERSNREVMERA